MNIPFDNNFPNNNNGQPMAFKATASDILKASDTPKASDVIKASDSLKSISPLNITSSNSPSPAYISKQANRRKSIITKRKSFIGRKSFCQEISDLDYIKSNITNDYYNNESGTMDPFIIKCTDKAFTIHHLIKAIDECSSETKLDYLISLMAKNYIDKSFFVIPQLCSLVMSKKYIKPLARFILNQCVNEMKFSLIASWIISSSAKYEIEAKQKHEDFHSEIEMALVNGSAIENIVLNEEELFTIERDKEFKSTYFNLVRKFYMDLKRMCEKLMKFEKVNLIRPDLERKNVLMKYIKTFNVFLRKMYNCNGVIMEIKKSTRGFYRGIILPFEDSDTAKNKECNVIVNFLAEHSFCFNTKARVPVKMVFECVKEIDLADWDYYYLEEVVVCNETEPEQDQEDENEDEDFANRHHLHEEDTNRTIKCTSPNKKINTMDDYNLSPINSPHKGFPNHSAKNIIALAQCVTESNFPHNDQHSTNSNSSYNSIDHIKPFGEQWIILQSNVQSTSHFGKFPSYSLKGFIAKANDDLRQELLTMQLIKICNNIFLEANIPLNLHPYEIVITSDTSGLIEYLPNTLSIDAIKKLPNTNQNLNTFFREFFQEDLLQAQQNFVESYAAYCIITYLIAIKDRHNGNILLDIKGNIIHIDYGFILGISPGGNFGFEDAPFKLTQEYIDIMDGVESSKFECFKTFMALGLTELQKHYIRFEKIIEIAGKTTTLPCFVNQKKKSLEQIINEFKGRLHIGNSFDQNIELVEQLINQSKGNKWTKGYDWYQKQSNQIES